LGSSVGSYASGFHLIVVAAAAQEIEQEC
jgi:hypothetical protein